MPLIDANIFLEVLLKQQRSKACKAYLRRVKDGEISAMTTSFIVDTVSILMDHAECEPRQIRKFLLALLKYKGLMIYELSLGDRVTATVLMDELRLDFDDATVCAAMRAANSKEIVSFDKHFDGVAGIRRIEP
jgi:predicted nucleic acid-binding protein